MWQFLARNKQVAAMLGVLAIAAIVVILMATRGSGYSVIEGPMDETKDISDDPRVFASHRSVFFKLAPLLINVA